MMNEDVASQDHAGKCASDETSRKTTSKKMGFTIDCAKMRRWHGAPPIMHGQSEKDFENFIASLATCVDRGDALTESLVYRYGVERYRTGQLLFQRAKLGLIHHYLFVEFTRRDEERRKHRENKKEEGPDKCDFVKTSSPSGALSELVSESIDDVRRNMHYMPKHKLDEMTAAREFEAAIDRYRRVEVLIDDCEARAKGLLRLISLHDVQLAQRVEAEANERWMEYLDAQLADQERERQVSFAASSSMVAAGDAAK